MYGVLSLRRAAMTKFVTFGVRFCLQRGFQVQLTFQYIPVILNLLEGGSEQLRRCVPGEASDTRFYPKPGWFSTDQATKSRRISKTVSRVGKISSSRPAPVFAKFKYSVIYKLFFQQEITDAEVGTSHADR